MVLFVGYSIVEAGIDQQNVFWLSGGQKHGRPGVCREAGLELRIGCSTWNFGGASSVMISAPLDVVTLPKQSNF